MIAARVGIIDLDIGNLRSVANAVYSLGHDYRMVERPDQLLDVTHVILPGVGAFQAAMERMVQRDFVSPIKELASDGRPLLGLCLGMQLLSSTGDEGGEPIAGLDLIPGSVRRLNSEKVPFIPHVGWNSIDQRRRHVVLDGVPDHVDVYFVHSYFFSALDPEDVISTTNCGQEFPSIVGRNNIIGFQFHPEKSQRSGLRLIDNFCQWDGRC